MSNSVALLSTSDIRALHIAEQISDRSFSCKVQSAKILSKILKVFSSLVHHHFTVRAPGEKVLRPSVVEDVCKKRYVKIIITVELSRSFESAEAIMEMSRWYLDTPQRYFSKLQVSSIS